MGTKDIKFNCTTLKALGVCLYVIYQIYFKLLISQLACILHMYQFSFSFSLENGFVFLTQLTTKVKLKRLHLKTKRSLFSKRVFITNLFTQNESFNSTSTVRGALRKVVFSIHHTPSGLQVCFKALKCDDLTVKVWFL